MGATHCDPLPPAVGEATREGGEVLPPLAPPAAGVDDQQGSPTPLPLLIQASAAEKPDRTTSATTITPLPARPMNKAVLVACIAFPSPSCTHQHLQQRCQTRGDVSHILDGPL